MKLSSLLAAALLLSAVSAANATDRVVTSLSNSGPGSLREAVSLSVDGDSISFSVAGTIVLTGGALQVDKSIAINGPGARILAITNYGHWAFLFPAGRTSTLSGLTIRDGHRFGESGLGGDNPGQPANGVGLYNEGTLTVSDCAFINNRGDGGSTSGPGYAGGSVYGGAIYNVGVLTVNRCTFAGNELLGGNGGSIPSGPFSPIRGGAGGQAVGAAVYNAQGASLTITNSTLANNTATGGNGGNGFSGGGGSGGIGVGGIYNAGNLTISATTITRNIGFGGKRGSAQKEGFAVPGTGGLETRGGTVTVQNTIIADNRANGGGSPDVSGTFTSGGFNLIGIGLGSSGFTSAADQVGTTTARVNPRLDSLQNNGGPTDTCAPFDVSPAVDKGASFSLNIDQRGSSRPVDHPDYPNAPSGDGSDIGAFEKLQVGSFPAPTPVPSQLANLSTRVRVGNSDEAAIGGFIVTGTEQKTVMLRGIGPSLPANSEFGGNPSLELRDSIGSVLAFNQDWKWDQETEIRNTGIAPTNDFEAAIIATLPANDAAYTVILREATWANPLGVVEIYDLDRTVDSRLGNISTRGVVSTGDDALIAGTIVLGETVQKVIVRAIGPSLSLPNQLEDPTLELRDQNGGVLDANNNWVDSPNKQAIIDSTIPPTHDLESAIVANLPSNGASYTAIVRGVGDTTGIALVEIYVLD